MNKYNSKDFFENFYQYHRDNPQLRFGQLYANIVASDPHYLSLENSYYLTDNHLNEALKNMIMASKVVQYIIVNQDLKMSKGKIAAQCCHASNMDVINNIYNTSDVGQMKLFEEWNEVEHTKIILKGSQELLEELESKGYSAVRDAGHTELAPNSLTCVCVGLYRKNNRPDFLNKLPLL